MRAEPEPTRWRRIRGAYHSRHTQWERLSTGSTNACWKGSGSSGEWFLKWYKNPQPGVHPEVEVAHFLHGKSCAVVPLFGGSLERLTASGERETVAIVQRWEPGKTAWDYLQSELHAGRTPVHTAQNWGRQVAALHRVLASGEEGSGFETRTDCAYSIRCADRIDSLCERVEQALESPLPAGANGAIKEAWEAARSRWRNEAGARETFRQALVNKPLPATLSRVHGDLHLAQIQHVENDRWLFIDFEGEPLRSLEERRQPDSPLRDVAGILRSFGYAGALANAPAENTHALRNAFLSGWKEQPLHPALHEDTLLEALVREKNLYETLYEIEHRPNWVWIPLSTL
jgi:predicted trehalose synthase